MDITQWCENPVLNFFFTHTLNGHNMLSYAFKECPLTVTMYYERAHFEQTESELIMEQQTCIILYSTSQKKNVIYPKGSRSNNLQPLLLPLGYTLTKWIDTSIPGLEVWLTSTQCASLSKDCKVVICRLQLRSNQKDLFSYVVVTQLCQGQKIDMMILLKGSLWK